MRKRFAVAIAVLAAAALAAGAVPAFSEDSPSGAVVGTVNVAEPAAPCVRLGTTAVDFGTLSFSDPAAASTPFSDASPAVHFTACATAPEKVYLAAGDAEVPSGGTWDVMGGGFANTCSAGLNRYQPRYGASNNLGSGLLYNPGIGVGLNFGAPLPVGQETDVTFGLMMPCQGSAGAGEVVSMTFSFLAVLA